MNYPKYFDNIETIKLQDMLANFLGAFENGIVEFSYLDVVKSAGHSCPTVAGAFLMVREGLKALYKGEIPQRGEISISFKEDAEEGVAGVIANVVTQITGATETSGFKGIGGKFVRHGLMTFNDDISSSIKLNRLDTEKSVEVHYDPNTIPGSPLQQSLMQKIMQDIATADDNKLFGELWQQRVENIFNNVGKVITIVSG
ncbi:MAG: hypothetical protein H8E64_01825 [Candidatus Marinimicrobia bacterium]|nr:hypothetical protein [Candidatus Neomarinimicrobiota bacterium]